MGALLGRFGEAVVGLPGGCDIGPRPIDQHIKGFEALGARVEWENGAIHLKAERLVGARIYLDVVSVGATINIMLAAAMAEGQTIIENVAKEPEIIDVATLLSSMGAQIKGVGTDMIKIIGVPELRGCRHSIIPDRIEAGTYMIAAAASGGDVILDNVIPKHLDPITAKLREIGIEIEEGDDTIRVTAQKNYRAIDLKTLPYPGFPTDLQQPITTLLTLAEGTSIVTDNIYSSRFKHVEELRKLGANIYVEGRSAVIHGGTALIGTKVIASDLRAGASLVVAGLMAEGVTEIANVEYIDRGYEKLEEKITALGGEIWREKR
jgi:UDP-N-acetylglucosamine 1-carboxyvinyltransferase